MIVKMVREGVVVGRGGGGNDAVVWYNHLYLVPKPATLEGRIKKREEKRLKPPEEREEH